MESKEEMNKRLKRFMSGMSQEDMDERNRKELERQKRDYTHFIEAFRNGLCCFCGLSLSSFDETKPCMHWLLRPDGFKPKHFKKVYDKFEYHRIDPYLRWVANTDGLFKNINDFDEEKPEGKIFEYTIKYKGIEWSFSCSESDFQGHPNRRKGREPHYHFQMRINDQQFINYGDTHIPFTQMDIFLIYAGKGEFKEFNYVHIHGAGMSEVLNQERMPKYLDGMTYTDDESKAAVHIQSMVRSKTDEGISSEEIKKIMDGAKAGTPMWKTAQELGLITSSIVTPSDAVPEIANRTPRGKKKKMKSE